MLISAFQRLYQKFKRKESKAVHDQEEIPRETQTDLQSERYRELQRK